MSRRVPGWQRRAINIAALGAEARVTGAGYDIDAFVKKMERLYLVMHELSRWTGRAGVAAADLSFLSNTAHPS